MNGWQEPNGGKRIYLITDNTKMDGFTDYIKPEDIEHLYVTYSESRVNLGIHYYRNSLYSSNLVGICRIKSVDDETLYDAEGNELLIKVVPRFNVTVVELLNYIRDDDEFDRYMAPQTISNRHKEKDIEAIDRNEIFYFFENEKPLKVDGGISSEKPVMAMARMVLDDISVESNGEISTTGYIVPYAISMEKLFEVYVRAYLKKNGIESYRSKSDKGIRLEKYDNKTDVFMEEEGLSNPGKYISGSIKPDLILTDRESGETVVFDVKYKDYTNGDSRNDRLQLLAYSMMMNANNVGIILPTHVDVEIFDARRINSMENRIVKYHQMLLGIMKDNPTIADYIKDNTFEKKE